MSHDLTRKIAQKVTTGYFVAIINGRDKMSTTRVGLAYQGGDANEGRLDLHDAASSLMGLARAINYVVHAYVNNQKVRDRLAKPEGARTYFSGAKKGCFEEHFDVEFEKAAIKRIGPDEIEPNFLDYFNGALSFAVGRDDFEPATPYVRNILQKDKGFFEEIGDRLEEPLRHLHRPLRSGAAETIEVLHQSDTVFTFDADTLAYFDQEIVDKKLEHLTGNVTRYNGLTGFGRAYIDELEITVSFRIKSFKKNVIAQRAASASLNEWVNRKEGKRTFVATRIRSGSGRTKRLVVNEILQV